MTGGGSVSRLVVGGLAAEELEGVGEDGEQHGEVLADAFGAAG